MWPNDAVSADGCRPPQSGGIWERARAQHAHQRAGCRAPPYAHQDTRALHDGWPLLLLPHCTRYVGCRKLRLILSIRHTACSTRNATRGAQLMCIQTPLHHRAQCRLPHTEGCLPHAACCIEPVCERSFSRTLKKPVGISHGLLDCSEQMGVVVQHSCRICTAGARIRETGREGAG
eukprot:6181796-Pleurochrysis_carterae.AAC.2